MQLPTTAARSFVVLGGAAMQSVPPRVAPIVPGRRILSRGPLFGRLTKAGKEYLLRRGWEMETDNDGGRPSDPKAQSQAGRLAFVWPTKSGPQFETTDEAAAHVRPFPKEWTDAFDDKLKLARAIEGTAISPTRIASPPDEAEIQPDQLYFVKHRHGAQGKSVYAYNKDELLEWTRKSRNAHDFVIQEEVLPSLHDGRKYVLRCHILMILRDDSSPRTVLHRPSIVCQHHASIYRSGEKSAHISQAGKKHPAPILLQDLDSTHPAAGAYDKIRECSQSLVKMVAKKNNFCDTEIAAETTCFALLGADLLIDKWGEVKVCEVNSHPALGWGTMAKVPARVFSHLVEETLSMLLFDGSGAESGFDPLFQKQGLMRTTHPALLLQTKCFHESGERAR